MQTLLSGEVKTHSGQEMYLGLRSLSETELNYLKWGSEPVVERTREGRPTLEAKQNFLVS